MKKHFIILAFFTAFIGSANANDNQQSAGAPIVTPEIKKFEEVSVSIEKAPEGGAATHRSGNNVIDSVPSAPEAKEVAQAKVTESAQANEPKYPPEYHAKEKHLSKKIYKAKKAMSHSVSRIDREFQQLRKEYATEHNFILKSMKTEKASHQKKMQELDAMELEVLEAYKDPLAKLDRIMEDNSQATDAIYKIQQEGLAEMHSLLAHIANERDSLTYQHLASLDNLTEQQRILNSAQAHLEADLMEKKHNFKNNYAKRKKEYQRALAVAKKRYGVH